MLTMYIIYLVKITVTSINCALDQCGKSCGSNIIIDSKNHSPKSDGINIAILNPFTGTVKSTASFSTTQSPNFNNFIRDTKTGYVIIVTSQLLCSQELATNLRKQKAIIYAFKKLGSNIGNVQPLMFRSGVYIYCKDYCYRDMKTNMRLPIQVFKTTSEDPILISFTLDALPCLEKSYY